MTANARLKTYLVNRWIGSNDGRWEDVLGDLRRGWIRLEREPGQRMARIVVVVA